MSGIASIADVLALESEHDGLLPNSTYEMIGAAACAYRHGHRLPLRRGHHEGRLDDRGIPFGRLGHRRAARVGFYAAALLHWLESKRPGRMTLDLSLTFEPGEAPDLEFVTNRAKLRGYWVLHDSLSITFTDNQAVWRVSLVARDKPRAVAPAALAAEMVATPSVARFSIVPVRSGHVTTTSRHQQVGRPFQAASMGSLKLRLAIAGDFVITLSVAVTVFHPVREVEDRTEASIIDSNLGAARLAATLSANVVERRSAMITAARAACRRKLDGCVPRAAGRPAFAVQRLDDPPGRWSSSTSIVPSQTRTGPSN